MLGGPSVQLIIKFYSAWFCPYAQRTWIALNQLNLNYELIESLKLNEEDEYVKHDELLRLNPKGLVPTLDIDGKVVVESIGTIEYLHKYFGGNEVRFVTPSLVEDAHFMNQNVCSPFYKILIKQDVSQQESAWKDFVDGLKLFTANIESNGFFKSNSLNIVDITVFPWVNRLFILDHYRGKNLDKNMSWVEELNMWYDRMISHQGVVDTIANRDQLVGVYKRYFQGTAKSKVADAVRAGRNAHDLD